MIGRVDSVLAKLAHPSVKATDSANKVVSKIFGFAVICFKIVVLQVTQCNNVHEQFEVTGISDPEGVTHLYI